MVDPRDGPLDVIAPAKAETAAAKGIVQRSKSLLINRAVGRHIEIARKDHPAAERIGGINQIAGLLEALLAVAGDLRLSFGRAVQRLKERLMRRFQVDVNKRERARRRVDLITSGRPIPPPARSADALHPADGKTARQHQLPFAAKAPVTAGKDLAQVGDVPFLQTHDIGMSLFDDPGKGIGIKLAAMGVAGEDAQRVARLGGEYPLHGNFKMHHGK